MDGKYTMSQNSQSVKSAMTPTKTFEDLQQLVKAKLKPYLSIL